MVPGISENIKPVVMKLRSFINEIITPNEDRYNARKNVGGAPCNEII